MIPPAVFEKFRYAEDLLKKAASEGSLLLAVSGGIDSSVLVHLVANAGLQAEIAHINYGLRGAESDADEQFVRDMARNYGWPCHVLKVAADEWLPKRASIQTQARNIRFAYFSSIIQQNPKLKYVVLAHQLNDLAETMLHNFIRGAGIKGISSMQAQKGNRLRPLLHISRDEIMAYANYYGVNWRDDSSNAKLYYTRNKIRHQLMPVVNELNPSFAATAYRNHQRLSMEAEALDQVYKLYFKRLFSKEKPGTYQAAMSRLMSSPVGKYVLYRFLAKYGVHIDVVEDLCLHALAPGVRYFTSGNLHIKLSNGLLEVGLKSIAEGAAHDAYVVIQNLNELLGGIDTPIYQLHASIMDNLPTDFRTKPNEALLDLAQIQFPITLRKRVSGDKMKPLGMKSYKKISDIFTDKKIDYPLRQSLPLLTDAVGEIIWVPGVAFAEKCKLTAHSRQAVKLIFNLKKTHNSC